jgi:hypothetical protein
LLIFLFGITTPNIWSQQGAKAAVTDRPASPSNPAAAPETDAAVLNLGANSSQVSNELFTSRISRNLKVSSEIREISKFTPERTL